LTNFGYAAELPCVKNRKNMPLDSQWLQAFLFTELIELPIYCVALRGFGWSMRFVLAFGASLVTHPIVWWSITTFGQDRYWTLVTISEVGAVVVEAFYLRLLAVPRAFEWSLIANGASFGLGLIYHFLSEVLWLHR
jgi:hypothetical protein